MLSKLAHVMVCLGTLVVVSYPAHANGAELIDLTGSPLLNTENGRYVLKYAVECALPKGTGAIAFYNGETFSFSGDIGIAPSWIDRSLTKKEKAGVSACLLARTNAFGLPVNISLRSSSPELADLTSFQTNAGERAHYDVWEGRFFGDILSDEPQAFACRGDTRQHISVLLRDIGRVCTLPDGQIGPEISGGVSLCGFRVFASCDSPQARAVLSQFGNQAVDVYLPSNPMF